MDSFKTIMLTAGLVSVVTVLAEGLYPTEKYSRQLKYIFTLVLILAAAEPLVSGDVSFRSAKHSIEVSSEQIYEVTENTDEYFRSAVEKNISYGIKEYLREKNINASEIKTSINISASGSISINEIGIAVEDTAQEGEIIALIKEYTDSEAEVKIREWSEDEEDRRSCGN